jgi:hypothetical protein
MQNGFIEDSIVAPRSSARYVRLSDFERGARANRNVAPGVQRGTERPGDAVGDMTPREFL